MTGQLARLAGRQLFSHPWQLVLAIIGIALGVSVAVSIDLANGSALRAFRLATEAVSGRATHQILGGPAGLPDDLYRRLRLELGVRHAAPIVEGDVAVVGRTGRTLHVLGIDPFVDAEFRPYLGAEDRRESRGRDLLSRAGDLVGRSGTALITASTAHELGLAPGRDLTVDVGGDRRAVTIVGLLEPADSTSARALEQLVVTDIATAQELFAAVGHLTRIDLIVDDPKPLAVVTGVPP